MRPAELQLQLIGAVYRVESARQDGVDLDRIRARCEALLDMTAPRVVGDARLRKLVEHIRQQLRGRA